MVAEAVTQDPEVIAMQVPIKERVLPELGEEYLGYRVYHFGDRYVAIPMDWDGEIFDAETQPQLRKRIWRWWYQVQ